MLAHTHHGTDSNNGFKDGLCGNIEFRNQSSKPTRTPLTSQKRTEDVIYNRQNKWRIPYKESLFVSWMSINPNLHHESVNDVDNNSTQVPQMYYKFSDSDGAGKSCIPLVNENNQTSYDGKYLTRIKSV